MTDTIDDLITRLRDAGAERLVLFAGRPPLLVGEEKTRPAAEQSLSREAVTRMVEDLERRAVGPTARSNGQSRFRASAPGGPVRVQAELGEDRNRVLISPEHGPARGPGENETQDTGPAGAPDAEPDADPAAGPATESAAEPATGERAGPAATGEEAGVRATGEGRDDAGPETGAQETGAQASASGAGTGVSGSADTPEGRLRALLMELVDRGGSDLHVSAGERPFCRVDGEMGALDGEPAIPPSETREMVLSIAPERNVKEFEETHDTDFAYEIEGVARFRCNVFLDRNGVGGVFRQIPSEVWTAEKLGLSDAILDLCMMPKGLVVVTGPTGSGKSTTLSAMIDYINRNRADHIITIEDPIEFTHENRKCLVNQREVGVHTEGFKVALRAALREDPDIVLIGEMRDLETVEIALETAETGHLVFGTLHTNTAPSTVSRVIEQFPGEQQNHIRAMLADSLKGVIAQTLCKREGGGRVAAMEVLLVNSAASNLIREGKSYQLPSVMQTSGEDGMQTLNDALVELVEEGLVTPEEARRNAVDAKEFDKTLDRAQRFGGGRGGGPSAGGGRGGRGR